MSVVYNEMLQKKQAMERLAQQGKRKYEYDSDEDVEVMQIFFFKYFWPLLKPASFLRQLEQ